MEVRMRGMTGPGIRKRKSGCEGKREELRD
jgi:hypothetical protein